MFDCSSPLNVIIFVSNITTSDTQFMSRVFPKMTSPQLKPIQTTRMSYISTENPASNIYIDVRLSVDIHDIRALCIIPILFVQRSQFALAIFHSIEMMIRMCEIH